MQTVEFKIPKEVVNMAKSLENKGFEAYLVGGCVRDLFLNKKPTDWDITTNATPDNIMSFFPKTFYENDYGTVGVVSENVEDDSLKVVEITPYRIETTYSDNRRPDKVLFSKKLDDDLKRRDFTINAIALKILDEYKDNTFKAEVQDFHNGIKDLHSGIIRTVGEPNERFGEDALRLLRAVRLSATLNFEIEQKTEKAIQDLSHKLGLISKERIRDEFIKMVMSENPMLALSLCKKLGLLPFIIPSLEAGVGVEQNKAHSYTVFEHILRTVQHSAKKNLALEVRLAAIFHDIGKPHSRSKSLETGDWTFYGHDLQGAKIANKELSALRFPKEVVDKVVKLVRWHMFFSDTEQITLSAVRRLIARVGKENIWDLMDLRMCDRIGTGRPKESPYRLRKYKSMIEEVIRDPISVSMLKINGQNIMDETKLPPGPKIGFILHFLLEKVLEDPTLNEAEKLKNMALDIAKMPEGEIEKIGREAKKKKSDEEERMVGEIRKKYWVS